MAQPSSTVAESKEVFSVCGGGLAGEGGREGGTVNGGRGGGKGEGGGGGKGEAEMEWEQGWVGVEWRSGEGHTFYTQALTPITPCKLRY